MHNAGFQPSVNTIPKFTQIRTNTPKNNQVKKLAFPVLHICTVTAKRRTAVEILAIEI